MLKQKMDFTLVNTKTGAAFPLTVKPMTLGNKEDMDEWLRMVYIRKAFKNGDSIEQAEQEAERLDILSNCWFLSDNRRAARILYELSAPGMTWKEFLDAFFNLEVRSFTADDSEEVKRLKTNIDTFTDAYEFACKNPTIPEPESQPEPEKNPA